MEPGTALEISVRESGLLVHRHGGEASPGECTLVVEAHNPGEAPARLGPASLSVLDGEGTPLTTARYARALIWADSAGRRRFTSFDGELSPGERVQLRMFFALEGGLPPAVLTGKVALHYRAIFAAAPAAPQQAPVTVEGAPFHPQIVED